MPSLPARRQTVFFVSESESLEIDRTPLRPSAFSPCRPLPVHPSPYPCLSAPPPLSLPLPLSHSLAPPVLLSSRCARKKKTLRKIKTHARTHARPPPLAKKGANPAVTAELSTAPPRASPRPDCSKTPRMLRASASRPTSAPRWRASAGWRATGAWAAGRGCSAARDFSCSATTSSGRSSARPTAAAASAKGALRTVRGGWGGSRKQGAHLSGGCSLCLRALFRRARKTYVSFGGSPHYFLAIRLRLVTVPDPV